MTTPSITVSEPGQIYIVGSTGQLLQTSHIEVRGKNIWVRIREDTSDLDCANNTIFIMQEEINVLETQVAQQQAEITALNSKLNQALHVAGEYRHMYEKCKRSFEKFKGSLVRRHIGYGHYAYAMP
jgi:uncharacterized coiled-coil protein SlyX